MANGTIGTDTSSGNFERKLSPSKFNNTERNKLVRGTITDEEFESLEYDTEITEPGTIGTSGVAGTAGTAGNAEIIEEFEGGNECDFWEFDENSIEASEEELKKIDALIDCKNLPEKLKDTKNSNVNITKSVGTLNGKQRIKIEIENLDPEQCIFIESIRVITGISNSLEVDNEKFSNITKNSSVTSETDILSYVNTKIQLSSDSTTSLIDGIITDIPPCLTALNDKIGILVGPNNENSSAIDPGNFYIVGNNLPPGSDNLIGLIGSTGVEGIVTHIHAEWANSGKNGNRYWTVDQFVQWFSEKFKKSPTRSIIKIRKTNGRGNKTNIASGGVAAYFTTDDLLKFIDIDMLPLKDQIDGKKQPVPAMSNDFLQKDRNYAENRNTRYHYAIDVYPNKVAKGYKGKAIRRVYLKPGVKITSTGGSSDGSTGNAVQLLHPDGDSILMYHLSALWDNAKKVYYTYANPYTTLNQTGAGRANKGRTDITKTASNANTAAPRSEKKPSPCGVVQNSTAYSIDVDLTKYNKIPVWVLIQITGTFESKTLFHYFQNNG
jgi:hypothetical protein